MEYPRVAALTTADAFARHLTSSRIDLPFDPELLPADRSPLAQPLTADGVAIGNRFCILPMEGWDGTRAGEPSALTTRRWQNFGKSGAKFIWGGEAVAVRQDGRANPNQLLIDERTLPALARLREALVAAHRERFGGNADSDLHLGLQLTHSGRFACPESKDRKQPLVAYRHPYLDSRFPDGVRVLSDDELDRLVDDFVIAARRAHQAGFAFVDVKHCHGYLGHELLSAVFRPGRYGGSFENRTRFLRNVASGIRSAVPGLGIVVRVSIFDSVPFRKEPGGAGVPEASASDYRHGFGVLRDGEVDSLEDGRQFLRLLEELAIRFVCTSGGSPYYCPHVQRPALFPPVDGYDPPEDPLRGVARQIAITASFKREFPKLVFVGSAYSYLQEWLPHVAQRAVSSGGVDFVGLGRIALSYPDLPADVLSGAPLKRKLFCRTFSDCTNGPRMGLVSGCYPLDPLYVNHPDAAKLKEGKARLREAQPVAKA
jgi:2,4-dienoyl-CoA reductase-like NADH-dependent reductase (Old Yellow Enzyme family)